MWKLVTESQSAATYVVAFAWSPEQAISVHTERKDEKEDEHETSEDHHRSVGPTASPYLKHNTFFSLRNWMQNLGDETTLLESSVFWTVDLRQNSPHKDSSFWWKRLLWSNYSMRMTCSHLNYGELHVALKDLNNETDVSLHLLSHFGRNERGLVEGKKCSYYENFIRSKHIFGGFRCPQIPLCLHRAWQYSKCFPCGVAVMAFHQQRRQSWSAVKLVWTGLRPPATHSDSLSFNFLIYKIRALHKPPHYPFQAHNATILSS